MIEAFEIVWPFELFEESVNWDVCLCVFLVTELGFGFFSEMRKNSHGRCVFSINGLYLSFRVFGLFDFIFFSHGIGGGLRESFSLLLFLI